MKIPMEIQGEAAQWSARFSIDAAIAVVTISMSKNLGFLDGFHVILPDQGESAAEKKQQKKESKKYEKMH